MAQSDRDTARKDPSTTSQAYLQMSPAWNMINALLGGTEAMREAADAYLPQHDEESSANYQERLGRATLFNGFEITLDHLVGQPFSEPMSLNDDVPEQITELAEDIDLLGSNISAFCREWFRAGIAKAFCHVLVDYSSPNQGADGPGNSGQPVQPRTLADDLKEQRRPFWTLVQPENILCAFATVINGVERLTHVRIRELIVEKDGFSERIFCQIRVLEPGIWQVWRQIESGPDEGKWRMYSEGTSGIDVIPLITFYASRTGLNLGKPPLLDLAYLNVRHWQSTADQINILTVSRFPMLAVAGAVDQSGATMKIGPRALLGTRDPQGRFYYVEHGGAAIGAGRQDLIDLEKSMAAYGASFLRDRPDREPAATRVIDNAETTNTLKDMALRFANTVAAALDLTARWLNLEEGGSVTVNTDYTNAMASQSDLQAIVTARQMNELSHEDFLNEMQRRGTLSHTFDQEMNDQRIKDGPPPLIPGKGGLAAGVPPVAASPDPAPGGGTPSDSGSGAQHAGSSRRGQEGYSGKD